MCDDCSKVGEKPSSRLVPNNELLSCPFCGATPLRKRVNHDERMGYALEIVYSCPGCGCSKSAVGDTSKGGYADNSNVEAEALVNWNARAR